MTEPTKPPHFGDRPIEITPRRWPPKSWLQHPRECRTEHGLPDICHCGRGWT